MVLDLLTYTDVCSQDRNLRLSAPASIAGVYRSIYSNVKYSYLTFGRRNMQTPKNITSAGGRIFSECLL